MMKKSNLSLRLSVTLYLACMVACSVRGEAREYITYGFMYCADMPSPSSCTAYCYDHLGIPSKSSKYEDALAKAYDDCQKAEHCGGKDGACLPCAASPSGNWYCYDYKKHQDFKKRFRHFPALGCSLEGPGKCYKWP